ncbi:MAG: protein phosphatase 2C domain-containing protein [Deltaproteobacteria bacterium]|nr:protein phosphatase 2C domain-containing protein [Deltaproteobacteria bacterium]MCX7952648.1 protein phosphatase 2C domain-containing protein [Deltaproteobacteria bacterium]
MPPLNGITSGTEIRKPWIEYFKVSGLSHQGMVREDNQDSLLIFKNKSFLFCAICDGMGGAPGGKLASEITVEVLKNNLEQSTETNGPSLVNLVIDSVKQANDQILSYSLNNSNSHNMGTTFCGALFFDTSLHIFNVGDSRLYRIRQNKIQPLTEDHTLVNDLIKSGLLNPSDPHAQALSHILTRSVGPAATLMVDNYCLPDGPVAGDYYLLCSDGLYNMVLAEEILQVVRSHEPGEASKKLIEMANSRGGLDNISVIVIKVESSFPVGQSDIELTKDPNGVRGYVPAQVVDDIYTPIISDYLQKIEKSSKSPRNLFLVSTLSFVAVGILFLISEALFFSDLWVKSASIEPVGVNVNTFSVPDNLAGADKALRLAFLQSRLKNLYGQLEMLKVSTNMTYDEIAANIARHKEMYAQQLERNMQELNKVSAELKIWKSRKARLQVDDLTSLARELSFDAVIRDKLKVFEEASWNYLNNVSNQEVVDKLFKARTIAEDDLKNTIERFVEQQLSQLEKKQNFLILEGNLFRGKISELNQQEQFYVNLKNQEESSRRQLEERIANEILTIEAELKTLNK